MEYNLIMTVAEYIDRTLIAMQKLKYSVVCFGIAALSENTHAL